MGVLPWTCRCGLNPSPSKNRGAPGRPPPPTPRGRRSKYTGQSVRTMPMRVITVGKKRSQGTQLLVEEYKEKLGHYCAVEDTLIKSNPKLTSDVKVQIEAEDASMMQQLKAEDFVVVLDENGKDVMSEQIADLIGDAGSTGSSRLTFCIGGPYGLGVQVRERADATIRLSSLVLNHQVALIVLMEQLYRAWTIIKGQKYHH
ncbi:hypothetical protein QYE76_046148 [Lolium multiflorum]|uniref:RNA methyltransferase n=1 Tax=Lolium multiflorum TaxID=4521 RepID=A0AAD8TMF1_LOLMU|nr:hypothetical protein QYE76_046148 [Lolium multiflorum]